MATSKASECPCACFVVLMGIPGSGKSYFANQIETYMNKSVSENGRHYRVFLVKYDSLISVEQQAKFALETEEEHKWKEARRSVYLGVERAVAKLGSETTASCSKISDNVDILDQSSGSLGVHKNAVEGNESSHSVCEMTLGLKATHEHNSRNTGENVSEAVDNRVNYDTNYLLQGCIGCDTKNENVVIIVDDNMYYRSMRYEYYQLARKYSIGYCQFYLDCSVSDAVVRNKERDNKLPDEVILKMSQKMEVPDPVKYSWEQFSFIISMKGREIPLQLICDVIDAALFNPVFPVEDLTEKKQQARTVCSASVVHQVDRLLRKLVHCRVNQVQIGETMSKDDVRVLSKQLNATRQVLLEDIKCGAVMLPVNVVQAVQGRKEGALSDLRNVMEGIFNSKLSFEGKNA